MIKQGIIIGSFGTSYDETRRKTIDVIGEEVQAAYPEAVVLHAFTSDMVRRILGKRNDFVPSVTQAAEEMLENQVTHLVVQPTHLLDGIEFEKLRDQLTPFFGRFEFLGLGTPLLSSQQDLADVAEVIHNAFPQKEGEGVVLMGHGSAHEANMLYDSFIKVCDEKGYSQIFLGTAEGTPTLEDVITQLKQDKISKVHLTPLMLVAGDHATNDMAGEDDESWKNQLESLGYEVSLQLKGLGEYPEIRQIYLKHLEQGRE